MQMFGLYLLPFFDYTVSVSKAGRDDGRAFPLPELTARVNGPS